MMRSLRSVRSRLAVEDDGFGLAELAVYALLSVVILAITGALLISSINTRVQVTALTRTANTGQLIASSVQEGVRNASGPLAASGEQMAGIKAEPTTSTGQLLRARVAVGAANGSIVWRCQAWFYSSVTGGVYDATDATGAIPDPVGFTVVNGSHVPTSGTTHWRLLGDEVKLAEGETQFFGGLTDHVVLKFVVTSDNVSLVLIPSTVVRRTLPAGGTGPTSCY